MKKTLITAVILLSVLALFAETPIVTNVTASQRTDGSKIVDITYDVSDAENDTLLIEVLLSDDGGATFTITPDTTNFTGDFGEDIMPGTGKSITWNAGDETGDFDGDNFQLKITADDDPVTNECEDYDGNIYQTIQIGDQLWMAENLKVTHYRNGDAIQYVQQESAEPDVWENLSTGAYGYYNDSQSNQDTYGNLYNWYAVDDSRNIAPEGWHIPTDEEIKELEMALGMSQSEADDTGWRGTNEGSKLAGRADLWTDGALENNAEFDTSGFSFLPGGYRYYDLGGYNYLTYLGYFWSATDSGDNAWRRDLYCNNPPVYRLSSSRRYGFSVRCVRD